MAIFLKSAESKFTAQMNTSLNFIEEIETALQNDDIHQIIKYSSVEQISYILYKYPHIIPEDLLISLLKNRDTYISYKSFSLLTDLYKNQEHRKEYLVFFKYMLKEDSNYEEKNELLSLFVIFISGKLNMNYDLEKRKSLIINDENIVKILDDLIFIKEVQYNILLILYVLSFNREYIDKLRDIFLKKIICILKDKSREKILRISYSVLVNILKYTNLSINQIYELRKITLTLCDLNISDEDLRNNLKISKEVLEKKHAEYSIEKYTEDLFRGILEDHDYHYDEVFWNTNMDHINKNIVDIIKILKKYLKSNNNEWVCLACNDIYMIIKGSPNITRLINKHQVNDVLYELTKSENDEVRFKAIQALYASIFSEWN
ncbi:V-type proton ATPase subunit H (VMA13) [Vairimorpha necatrix]|uniref:V-type proton ATPase subunit H (VMA13) n=1 Tax=Vairimorpha necatrix TaxID=6039 RepID=A0AAX4J966_9MICR